MSLDDVVKNALHVKLQMDDLTLLGNSLYLCMECGQVTSWWKPGGICYNCETESERQQDERHD